MPKRDIDKLIRELRKYPGVEIEEGAKKWKVRYNGHLIIISKTPSANNAIHKIHADLRRAGIDLGDKRS